MRIVNLKTYRGPHTYCGRAIPQRPGSPLGNPYKVGDNGDVSGPLERYRAWLWKHIDAKAKAVIEALLAIDDDSVLACWCVDLEGADIFTEPERCHCQIVAKASVWLRSQKTE